MNTDSCDMIRVETGDALFDESAKPGMFCIKTASEENGGVTYFRCRLPNDSVCVIPIHLASEPNTSDRSDPWLWDGNLDRPTLTPSIWHDPRSGSKHEWHGFVTAGRMVSC